MTTIDPEKAYQAVLAELKRYVAARSTKRKDARSGTEWESGVTIVSAEDRRLEEMARLSVEAMMRTDDGRVRQTMEIRALQPGDVFTWYAIIKDGVSSDEEVTVVKRTGTSTRPRILVRGEGGGYREFEVEDGATLVSVYRPTLEDFKKELADGDHA